MWTGRDPATLKTSVALCKDCILYKSYGFSSVCKQCESDGNCPICGQRLRLGDDLAGPMYICPNGHLLDRDGREFWLKFFLNHRTKSW